MLPTEIAQRPHIKNALAKRGSAGSRYQIATPAAVVDLDILEKNIATASELLKGRSVKLRPHSKSHKCSFLARLQVEAGVAGICCAKLGEAEAMAENGIQSILVTSPIFGQEAAARALQLASAVRDFAVVVDSTSLVEQLGNESRARSFVLPVLIDVDVGQRRTGVVTSEQAVELARDIAKQPFLKLRGVQGYGGSWQHIRGAEKRQAAVAEGMLKLATVVDALRKEGFALSTVTGGGTGTLKTDLSQAVLNECQPGSYIFMDREYQEALRDDSPRFETSLFVQAQVISANQSEYVTLDAGLKAFATDGPTPRPASRGFENCEYKFFGDEFGLLTKPRGLQIALGDRIEFEVPHCDPTVDRYDVLHLVRGSTLIEIVPIEGRGRSQ
ncbi:MAG TPA: DSD1 family PLP-dependent enzyme [Candidatus Angelobacter sp.]|jgi:D-serine deaminase-like pyridoxal phosphate-dependent protein|nr:DSD1 family PLP-dependent enzyme [Candidatus Angelobacter sp.]